MIFVLLNGTMHLLLSRRIANELVSDRTMRLADRGRIVPFKKRGSR